MYDFTKNKATNLSISKRYIVYGIGINDSNYMVTQTINGRLLTCPYYRKWHNMLERCYSSKYQEKNQTYMGCSVEKEWLYFMNFRGWMIAQNWKGMQLDKDIKIKGNKIYSSDSCLFIPQSLNSLLCDTKSIRGQNPQGVYLDKKRNKLMAVLSFNGKQKKLGRFNTTELAVAAYKTAKSDKIQQLIDGDTYPMATQYLAQHT